MGDEMFGPYRLDALLGRGGMGEVYRALDTRKNGRRVALKRLPPGLAEDSDFQQRFLREADITAQLSDPHVIPIHDYGVIDGQPYLDMRLVDGSDLTKYLQRYGALPPSRAVDIVSQVASALDTAHRAELIHRDVNPNNVLLNRPGAPTSATPEFVYLIDFGIAANLQSSTRRSSTAVVGTIAYMAPERFSRSGDHRVDIYALGCMLYTMLTGVPAFTGDHPVQLMAAHLGEERPRPSNRRPDLPGGLDDVVVRALARNPDERFTSAGYFADAARSALDAAVEPAPANGSIVIAGSPPPDNAHRTEGRSHAATVVGSQSAPAPSTQEAEKPSSGRRRRTLSVGVAVSVSVALLLVVTMLVLTRQTDSASRSGSAATPTSPAGDPAQGIASDAVRITATAANSALPTGTPGTGKPAVVIGSKNFAEQTVLGELYTQALKAKGYNVSLKSSIGGSELIDKSLESNQIQMFPEYLGETVTSVAKLPAPTSASDTYNKAKQWLEANRGSTVLLQTAFEDTDGIVVTTQYAQEKGLESISDLSKVAPGGQGVTVAGPLEFQDRETGLVGMKKTYNLPNVGYLPAPAGSQYTAVDQGSAQAANVFTTDYQLATGKYTLLTDPQAVFGYQYVAPIVKQDVLDAQGPEFAATLNWVSGLLTDKAIQALNQQVQGNNQPAGQVAQQFLAANGLQ